jgi:hypothetical protein
VRVNAKKFYVKNRVRTIGLENKIDGNAAAACETRVNFVYKTAEKRETHAGATVYETAN